MSVLSEFFEFLERSNIVKERHKKREDFPIKMIKDFIGLIKEKRMKINVTLTKGHLSFKDSYKLLNILNELRKSDLSNLYIIALDRGDYSLDDYLGQKQEQKFRLIGYDYELKDHLFFITFKESRDNVFNINSGHSLYIEKEGDNSVKRLLKNSLPKAYRIRKMDGEEGLNLTIGEEGLRGRTISGKREFELNLSKSRNNYMTLDKIYEKHKGLRKTADFLMEIKFKHLEKILEDLSNDSDIEIEVGKHRITFTQEMEVIEPYTNVMTKNPQEMRCYSEFVDSQNQVISSKAILTEKMTKRFIFKKKVKMRVGEQLLWFLVEFNKIIEGKKVTFFIKDGKIMVCFRIDKDIEFFMIIRASRSILRNMDEEERKDYQVIVEH